LKPVIKSKGYKIPILELELRLLELPFIAEGCILPVSDENNSGQVAALVRLSGSSIPELSQHQSRLGFLRDQLAPALPAYVLPTILRVLQDSDEIPRTASLKVLRRKAVEKYFALSDGLELPVDIERWDYQIQPGEVQHSRIWGWAGLKARY
jgi:malonyl-CoA/methylmalonyl-CoA synthetase